MKTKKILSVLLTFCLFTGLSAFSVSALEYGKEWDGYESSATVSYTDVPTGHWAYENIARTTNKQWFGGYPDGTFRPDASISRAEALKVFAVFLGLELNEVTDSSYYDVDVNDWFAPYIEAGKNLFPQRTSIQGKIPFQPNMPITREDAIYAIVIATGYEADTAFADQSVLNMFRDKNSLSSITKAYVAVAVQEELVSGHADGTIGGQEPLTRAEFATLLYRASLHGINTNFGAKLQSISIFPAIKKNLNIGESFTIKATAAYSDGTTSVYTNINPYNADDNDVVSINKNTITALKPGSCEIQFNDENLADTSIVIIVEKPDSVPTFMFDRFKDETEASRIEISGTVTDETDTEIMLTCNGEDIAVSRNGSFSEMLSLKTGTNSFTFVAENGYGNTTIKTITIIRTAPVENNPTEDDEDNADIDNNSKGEENDEREEDNDSTENGNIIDVPQSGDYLMEVCPPYQTSGLYYTAYLQSEGQTFLMGGTKYSNGFTFRTSERFALINLNGAYTTLELVIGHVDGSDMKDQTVTFLLDGEIVKEIEIKADVLPQSITLPLNHASQLKIMNITKNHSIVGLGNIIVK